MTRFAIGSFTGWLASFGAGLAVACGQDDGWIAQAPGFTPGTIQVDLRGNVYVASGINNRYNRSTNAVIKYSPEGRELWRRGLPNLTEVGVDTLGMGLDETGNIYIAGRNQLDISMSPWSLMKLSACLKKGFCPAWRPERFRIANRFSQNVQESY